MTGTTDYDVPVPASMNHSPLTVTHRRLSSIALVNNSYSFELIHSLCRYGFPSKTACEDFFRAHDLSPRVVRIDAMSAYWQKTEEVLGGIQFWRHEQNKYTKQAHS